MPKEILEITPEMRKEFSGKFAENLTKITDLIAELCLDESNRATTVLVATLEASCALIAGMALNVRDVEFFRDLSVTTISKSLDLIIAKWEKEDG